MNDRGTLVCSVAETSDYWQGDEAKWQRTFVDGKRNVRGGARLRRQQRQIRDPGQRARRSEAGKRIGAVTLTLKLNRLDAAAPKR